MALCKLISPRQEGSVEGRPVRGSAGVGPYSLYFVIIFSLLLLGWSVPAPAQPLESTAKTSELRNPICPMLESVALSNGLPLDFLVRVIWQESHFRPDVLGPITSDGQRAQGIAQFMPGTAAERGLLDPFNPVEALPKSGAFLAELRDEFGNLGLAAAAYNAGPQRVRDFLAGSRDLPAETRNYVLAITGHPVEDWLTPTHATLTVPPQKERDATNCDNLMALLRQTSARLAELQRSVPGWCRYLHHPNVAVCGSVHAREALVAASSHMRQRRGAKILRASFR